MRTTASWAFWRQTQYFAFFAGLLSLLVAWVYVSYFYSAPTCYDGRQNGDEGGVDCDGSCTRICAFSVAEPQVQWARSFKITDGQYNAVAYVENTNREAATPALNYTFSLYDDQGLITERTGTTVLPPDNVYALFEGRIFTGTRVPTRTLLDLEPATLWQPATAGREQFTVVDRTLSDIDSAPRLDATLENTGLEEAKNVEVVATIFDSKSNALTSSETFIDNFAPRSERNIVFTWPEPIAKTIRSCEVPTDVMLAIDVSGSMNDDPGTSVPEPITSVLSAAQSFVGRLRPEDQIGLVTFATDATIVAPLSTNNTTVAQAIADLRIDPKEETGSTNTGNAFLEANGEFASERHNQSARSVLVLLTDGLATAPSQDPEQYAQAQAAALKGSDVEVYTIGLGENVNTDFLRAVASDQSHVYQALSAADVDRIYQEITSSLCEDGPAQIDIVPKSDAQFVPI